MVFKYSQNTSELHMFLFAQNYKGENLHNRILCALHLSKIDEFKLLSK